MPLAAISKMNDPRKSVSLGCFSNFFPGLKFGSLRLDRLSTSAPGKGEKYDRKAHRIKKEID